MTLETASDNKPSTNRLDKLAPDDLYQLRRAIATAQRARLKAEMAQQSLRELVLDLEQRYGLLGRDMHLDVHTGQIRNGSSSSPSDNHAESRKESGE